MPQSRYKITLMPGRDTPEIIKAKQMDSKTRYIDITIADDDGVPMNLSGCTVRFNAVKPRGGNVFNNCVITDALNGKAAIELTSHVLALPGKVKADISVFGADETIILTTRLFYIDVQEMVRNDKAIESSNEFGALIIALEDVRQYKEVVSSMEKKMGNPTDGAEAPHGSAGSTIFGGINKIWAYMRENGVAGLVETVRNILANTEKLVTQPIRGMRTVIFNYTREDYIAQIYEWRVPNDVHYILVTAAAAGGGGGGANGISATDGTVGSHTVIMNSVRTLLFLFGGGGGAKSNTGGTTQGGAGGSLGGAGGGGNGASCIHTGTYKSTVAGDGIGGRGGMSEHIGCGGGGSLGGGGGGGIFGEHKGQGGVSIFMPGESYSHSKGGGRGSLGGGGGGGFGTYSGGGGGGGEAVINMLIAVTPGELLTIRVGQPGRGGTPYGGDGGSGIVIFKY